MRKAGSALSCFSLAAAISLSSQVATPGLAAASSASSTSATIRFASRSLAISDGLLSWMAIAYFLADRYERRTAA